MFGAWRHGPLSDSVVCKIPSVTEALREKFFFFVPAAAALQHIESSTDFEVLLEVTSSSTRTATNIPPW